MAPAPPAADRQRRKQVRLRLRGDLSIEPQKYEGRTYHVVKDPIGLHYYWFSEQEHFLLQLLDGRHTLEEAQKAFERRFRPERLPLEEVESFGQQLLSAGLAHQETPQAGRQLFERRQKRRRRELLAAWTNILSIKVPFYDPDRLLGWILPGLRWVFSPWFVLPSVGLMLAALLLVATHFETFRDKLPDAHEFFRFRTVAYLWVAVGVVKVIHEFGHGLTCKAFGGEVHEMGVLFLCLSPCLYCDVTDAWTLPGKWKRILISSAGMYAELLIASLATFLWWNTSAQPLVNLLCLSVMVVSSVNTVLINGNPLMRYDGYYILATWLEVPNLREQCNRYLKNLALEHGLGVEVPPEPPMAPARRVLFAVYAVASYVYRWVITFGMLWFLYRFLKPYKLGAISALLAGASAGSMVGWPLFALGQGLHKRGRLPDMKPRRVLISAAAVLGLLLAFFLVPLPVSRIHQRAVLQVQPEAFEKVTVPVPGTLDRIRVANGQRVDKGDILAEFSSLDLENRLEEASSEFDVRQVQVQALREQAAATTDPQERAKVEVLLRMAADEGNHYARQVDLDHKARQLLVLRAPRAGVVLGLPHKDEVGKFWDKGQETPFCSIGEPDRLRVLMPVSPADYHLLKEDLEERRGEGDDLEVTVRVQGCEGDTWRGKVGLLPEAEAREVPLSLTTKAGGPLAVKPGARPNTYEPQGQYYLVAVDLLEPGRTLCPGTMAGVKVHCRWRTGAWWLWRTLSTVFEPGLL